MLDRVYPLRGIDELERPGQDVALVTWEKRQLLLQLLEETYDAPHPSEQVGLCIEEIYLRIARVGGDL